MEDDDSAEFLGPSPSCLTTGPLKNKLFGECGDQLTPSKSYTPPSLQNLFNGSQLKNSFNWAGEGNLHPFKGVNKSPGEIQPSRDIGVQFNAVEFKKSLDEVKLRNPGQEIQTIKKTVRKKRKPDPSKLFKIIISFRPVLFKGFNILISNSIIMQMSRSHPFNMKRK